MNAETLVFTFAKNSRETVRASLGEYHGRQLADVRVYIVDEIGQPIATKKGLSVRVEDLPRLREAVDALIDEQARRAA